MTKTQFAIHVGMTDVSEDDAEYLDEVFEEMDEILEPVVSLWAIGQQFVRRAAEFGLSAEEVLDVMDDADVVLADLQEVQEAPELTPEQYDFFLEQALAEEDHQAAFERELEELMSEGEASECPGCPMCEGGYGGDDAYDGRWNMWGVV